MSNENLRPKVLHEVDTQLSFWEGSDQYSDGPLCVPGTNALLDNIAKLKKLSRECEQIKAVASTDFHMDYEVENSDKFPEFQMFGPHCMATGDGIIGADRIPQVKVFPEEDILYVPHHTDRDGQWQLEKFDIEKHRDVIKDPNKEIVIRKNGQNSFQVFNNPYTSEIYETIDPEKVFVYGVATDFCVHAAVMGFKEKGYDVYVITDAISGIFPEMVGEKMFQMKDSGAKFITTDEALEMMEA